MNRVLLVDVETFPARGYFWQAYDTNVLRIEEPTSICSWSAKWMDGGKHITKALPDYPGYKPGSRDDKALMADLWKLLDEADLVIAHNGDRFDVKKINFRFMVHGLLPPSPYDTTDTLKAVKAVSSHDRNNLNELCGVHSIGRKVRTGGADLWFDCLAGDSKAWKRMKHYNAHDVRLLEGWYMKLRPWIKGHPRVSDAPDGCPRCGSGRMQRRGLTRTKTQSYPRLQCQACGGWSRGTKSEGGMKVQSV